MSYSTPNPSIWVGSLDPNINEEKLYDYFFRVGPISSVRVCVDSATQKSLGYGYVNFQDPSDAEKALDLAGTRLGSKHIQISRIQRDPFKRRPGVRNIVVKKLPLSMDTLALKDLFSKFGRLTCVNLACNDKEESRGYARIGFESEESAVEAVKEMDKVEIDGHAIVVERYQPQHREEQYTNLYVKNLDPAVTEEGLKEVFSPFGTITSVKVRDLGEVQTEVGFAYVAFSDHASAAKAVEALNDTESKIAKEGMKLDVGRFRSREERQRERERTRRERAVQNSKYPNLYVKGFDDSVTSERLKALFERIGETVSAKVMTDPSGISRCFGFVSMKDQVSASQAIQELNGSTFLSPRPLFVTYAVRKDARRQNLEDRNRQQTRVRPQPMNGMPQMGFMAPNMFNNMNMQFMNRMPSGMMPFPGAGLGPLRHMQGPTPMHQMRAPRPMPMPPHKAPMPPMVAPPQSLAAILASAPLEQHRNILGERLYNYIVRSNPSIAPKITGMLLEMDNSEVVQMLENPVLLDSKIAEAKEVLQQHLSV
eukprot:gene6117-4399_t